LTIIIDARPFNQHGRFVISLAAEDKRHNADGAPVHKDFPIAFFGWERYLALKAKVTLRIVSGALVERVNRKLTIDSPKAIEWNATCRPYKLATNSTQTNRTR
jgi:hypothetical protein